MLSKHLTNIIQNLEKKKFREKYNLFKIEGEKLVQELFLSDMKVDTLIARPSWIERNRQKAQSYNTIEVNEIEMGRVSNFKSLPEVIALAQIPVKEHSPEEIKNELSIVLNGIQDPGNLGTILRLSDWFGVRHVFCDHDCANIFNPKSVQASMGAIFRVNVFYLDLVEFIPQFVDQNFPCYGAFLEGENIYRTELRTKGFIVMGNEGNGISPEIERFVTRKITIPSFAHSPYSTESLNVGVATGIILSEFKRIEYK
ncbi:MULTISPECIES: RNA methyltransferase [Butyricimonas]|uniref:RNA methyltransferase n=1 Tax=Butyricimonas hominis TaxID=2763032 RepID=A0ABR7CXS0_9BACT|nr:MULTISPECIES: RNA methyltransferase [Butyricimonas]MBC5620444.1 RNA methyltransferase [Butyricimonas hominis]